MNIDGFEDRLKELRPRLHRYCARMTGSAINGEDVLQDTFVKALQARARGVEVDNIEGWLFRIAHNASLDLLRGRSRNTDVPLTEDIEAAPDTSSTRHAPIRVRRRNLPCHAYDNKSLVRLTPSFPRASAPPVAGK